VDSRNSLKLLQLLQLCSSNFPIGSYSYSLGLEWAVHQGWVNSRIDTEQWASELIKGALGQQELPFLCALYDAFNHHELARFDQLSALLVASRETMELREEERHRAYAMLGILESLGIPLSEDIRASVARTQLAGFACVGVHWGLAKRDLLSGFSFAWIESLVYAALKLVPLGQSEAQQTLVNLGDLLSTTIDSVIDDNSNWVSDSPLSAAGVPVYSNPALAFASAKHETQYSRLFRS